MKPTDVPGTWQFIVDPRPTQQGTRNAVVSAFPGDKYDASRFPAMLRAYEGQITTDEELVADEWGNTLSGYAPIYNSAGKVVAIVGADIDASSVYTIQQTVKQRVIFILLLGIFISIIAGVIISKGVTKPIEKLTQGTRKIAAGDLGYKVEIKSKDEIGELAAAFNKMAANLSESREKLYDYFYRVVQAMVRSLEAKDHYTRGHSDRVSEYAGKIAIEMGIASDKVDLLKKAAELHDIGKLGIHEDVLNKTSSLSDKEWDAVHEHPAVGEEILKPVFLDTEMLSVVRSHHERFDGKGYPDGLKGEQISIFAQITCVADAYDAMTSSRSYRAALSQEEAIERLRAGEGTQFNPKVVEAFIKVLKS
jgi:putative nucleotidyltransferase with HDIG domain